MKSLTAQFPRVLGFLASSTLITLVGVGSAWAITPPSSAASPNPSVAAGHGFLLAQAGQENQGIEEEKKGIEEEENGIKEEKNGVTQIQQGIQEQENGVSEEKKGMNDEEQETK